MSLAQMESPPGEDDWAGASLIAADCSSFSPDDDDEQIADEPRSCYNCRYRRWTASSYDCSKENQKNILI